MVLDEVLCGEVGSERETKWHGKLNDPDFKIEFCEVGLILIGVLWDGLIDEIEGVVDISPLERKTRGLCFDKQMRTRINTIY